MGFQFVPGLFSTAKALAPILPARCDNVAFLVDGDDAGNRMAADLIGSGIAPGRVFSLRTEDGHGLEIEDFIDPDRLLDAANSLLGRHHPGVAMIEGPLSRERPMARLKEAYRTLAGRQIDEVELAYEILDRLEDEPDGSLVDAARSQELIRLAREIMHLMHGTAIQ